MLYKLYNLLNPEQIICTAWQTSSSAKRDTDEELF